MRNPGLPADPAIPSPEFSRRLPTRGPELLGLIGGKSLELSLVIDNSISRAGLALLVFVCKGRAKGQKLTNKQKTLFSKEKKGGERHRRPSEAARSERGISTLFLRAIAPEALHLGNPSFSSLFLLSLFDNPASLADVNVALRKIANLLKPDKEIVQDGDHMIIRTLSTFRNYIMDFQVGKEFEEDLTGIDDRKCMVRPPVSSLVSSALGLVLCPRAGLAHLEAAKMLCWQGLRIFPPSPRAPG